MNQDREASEFRRAWSVVARLVSRVQLFVGRLSLCVAVVLAFQVSVSGCQTDDSDSDGGQEAEKLPGDLEELFWQTFDAAYLWEKKICDCDQVSCLSRLNETRWQAQVDCWHQATLAHPEGSKAFFTCFAKVHENANACAKKVKTCEEIFARDSCDDQQWMAFEECPDMPEELNIAWEFCPNLLD